MNQWLNYHHLFYFKTIAEEQSVSKAAAKLNLGQPTLSAQLKQFENSIGVQLFDRKHKKLILTDQGRIALDYAKNIFKIGSEMYEVLQDRVGPTRTHIQIGALDSIPKQVILAMAQYSYKASPCSITLIEGNLDEMLRQLSAHKIDILVTNHLPTPSEATGLNHRQIIKKPVSIFASASFKNLKKDFPKSVSGQKYILPTYDSKLRQDFEHWARLNDISLDIVAETQDVSLKKLMAIEGIGLIPAAPHHVKRQTAEGSLIEIGQLSGVYEELHLMSAQRKINNPVAAKLMKGFNLV